MKIVWHTIPDFPEYEINRLGEIRRKSTGRVLKPFDDRRGYLRVSLNGCNVKVHLLVAKMFVPNPHGYEGTIQSSGGWGRIESYGPKFVENIVQATARDCLAEAMFRLEAAGFPIVFHVHDEVICEVPIGVSSAEELGALMGQPISWAPNLPLRADAYECEYYRKD